MRLKYKKQLLSIVAVLLLVVACQYDELMTFDSAANVYFAFVTGNNNTPANPGGHDRARADSLVFSFATAPGQAYRLLPVLIRMTGSPSDVDRLVAYEMISESTAILGEEVELLPAVIRAGRVTDTLWIRAYRTPRMLEERVSVRLRLLPNEYFGTDLVAARHGSPNHNVLVADTVFTFFLENSNKPPLWATNPDNGFFPLGPFSQAKYEMLMEVTGIGPDFLVYDPDVETAIEVFDRKGIRYLRDLWVRLMNQHLRRIAEETGQWPLDEHGNEIRMANNMI